MRIFSYIIVGTAVIIGAFLIVHSRFQNGGVIQDVEKKMSALPERFEPKTNNEGAVIISVLPQNISEFGAWEFKITLDTHSVELNEDLVATSVLVDDAGKEYAPVAWEGDPPGGHHRDGILIFNSIEPAPKYVELKIRNIGGVLERLFKWNL